MKPLRDNIWMLAAALWGLAEATLFFFVPDVLLSFIGLKRGAKAAAIASLAAAIGAGAGGAAMALWSINDPQAARAAVLAVPAISEAMAATAEAAMRENWFVATLLGPLSSTPFKLYAILAPHAGASVAVFAFAGVLARLPRFLLAALGGALITRWLAPRFGERALSWALAGFWVLFYVVFLALMPN